MVVHPFMDELKAPLNACSLETIPEAVLLLDGSYAWPLVISCYELNESSRQRHGHCQLHMIPVPDLEHASSMPLRFSHERLDLNEDLSGVLDGKWLEISDITDCRRWCFATAHADGTIGLYALEIPQKTVEFPILDTDEFYRFRYLGCSEVEEHDESGVAPLCLSLNWDTTTNNSSGEYSRLVSTYSNGRVALHDVSFHALDARILERDSWQAHTMFTTPSEVWSACFASDENNRLVLSCGDEGSVKIWDTRSTVRPLHVLKPFEAGATVAACHPRRPHLVAIGSYDETLIILDVRDPARKPLLHTAQLGGGIWRIKWHPYVDDRILVAAMHGGCRVLQIDGLKEADGNQNSVYAPPITCRVTKRFTEHDSMAYGADWLVRRHPARNGYFEAAASCSFYDRAVYLWDSVL